MWREKKKYFSEKLTSADNPRDFWSCIKNNEIAGNSKNKSLPSDISVNDMNKYFSEMGNGNGINDNVLNVFSTIRQPNIKSTFNFKPVTEEEIKQVMNEVKSNAVGNDEVSILMVKSVSPYALGAITHLINKSLEKGEFPKNWKASIVLPLAKKAAPTTVQHLRPISILPAMSKILEKIVIRQILEYESNEGILPALQSGFRQNHSTSSALLNLFSDVYDAKDLGRHSSLVLIDFSQAFDSICHRMLAAKLNYYGFSETAIDWVNSYLNGRTQVTRLWSETSEPLSKDCGVPQGSCLGPLLFNIYTADLPSCVQYCKVHLYADDCQIHLSYDKDLIVEAVSKINLDLKSICNWSDDNGLKLNIAKCSVMHIASQSAMRVLGDSGTCVTLRGKSLSICDRINTLGVVLDSSLTMSDHVTYACNRALGRLRGLYRYRSLLPESAKIKLIQSLILSVFYYCYPAYGNSISKEDRCRIQKMQNTAIRFVYCLKKHDHISYFRNAANLAPMDTVCRIMTCCMVHKALTLGEPRYLTNRLRCRDEFTLRSTRHCGRLHFPKVRLEVGRRSFSYFGPKLYNGLPEPVKSLSYPSFKSSIKKIMLS